MLTSRIGGTARQTSATVSLVGRADAGHGIAAPQSSSLTFAGSGIVTRTNPFCVRLVKSCAAAPLTRKSSASIARKSGSSTPDAVICANRACAAAGVSWKFWESMWQSEHARPLPPRPASVRSWKFALPRQTAVSTGAAGAAVQPSASSAGGGVVIATTGGERDGAEQPKGCGPQAFAVDRFHVLPSGIRRRTRADVSTMRGTALKVIRRALKRS